MIADRRQKVLTKPAEPSKETTVHLTVKQLMARWQCSEGFVRKLLGRGKIDYIKINTNVRITLAEVERFEQERTKNRYEPPRG